MCNNISTEKKKNGYTIQRKIQICYAGYFGHVQAHSPKTEKFFEILDEGLSTSKKIKTIYQALLVILHFKEFCNLIGYLNMHDHAQQKSGINL